MRNGRHVTLQGGYAWGRLDLDVDQCSFLGLRHGFVDGLQIFIDGIWRSLGGLIDKELDSGLRYFHWYRINNHRITLLHKNCQEAIYAL